MAVPKHTLVTFSGTFGTSTDNVEIWSFGIRTTETADATVAGLTTTAGVYKGLWVTHLAPVQPNYVRLKNVRVAALDELGHVVRTGAGGYLQGDSAGNEPGAKAVAKMPLQTATCVSLLTEYAGPSGKGRFFLPYSGDPLADDFRMTVATQEFVRDAAKGFLAGFVSAGKPPVVVSPRLNTLNAVTKVRVGRAIDTMRSRRSEVLESYVTTSVP